MLDSFASGLMMLLQPEPFIYLCLGMLVGLVIGFLPGLGGLATLALLLPLIIGMDQVPALAFILGAYGAVAMGGAITAILFNTPGTGEQVVTTFDGYPMTRQGKSARALGIAAASNSMGGLFGALVLLVTMPIAEQFITYIRPPEIFALGLVGIMAMGVTDARTVTKGVISGALGLMLSFIGLDPVTGISRLTFGNLALNEGLGITAITMGLFALSEMFVIFTRGVPIAGNLQVKSAKTRGYRVLDGILDTVRNWRRVLECSGIGAICGIIPGLGGTVAMFGSYGYAKRRSKDPGSFGKGNPVGIVAPEAADTAKEGGSFVPTLAFGIPGTSGMAIVIAILLVTGFTPGPQLIRDHLDIVFLIAWIVAFSNVLASGMGLALSPLLAKLAFLRPQILAPALIAVAMAGSFVDTRLFVSVLIALVFGFVGYLFKALGYSSAGLTLGFVLGPIIDQNLHLSIAAYGPTFLTRPITLALIILVVISVGWPKVKGRIRQRFLGKGRVTEGDSMATGDGRKLP